MVKPNKTKNKSLSHSQPTDPETVSKTRLRSLSVANRLLLPRPAEAAASLRPAKSVVKLDGRDVVKRGQRKSRFLFSFPGLLAPLSGGRIGELACLASKNPILYLEFPQGRMKLFGTHVYPKNKYLTLQLTRSAKGVMCEDIFESLIVFSEAWWVGKKEENPEELRLEFPQNLNEEKQGEFDFKGGAGATNEETVDERKPEKDSNKMDIANDNYDKIEGSNCKMDVDKKSFTETPSRQSSRIAGKSLNFAEIIPSDISDDEVKVVPSKLVQCKNECEPSSSKLGKREDTKKSNLEQNDENTPSMKPRVQATLSSMFEKAAEKKLKELSKSNCTPSPSTRKSGRSTPSKNKHQVRNHEPEEISSGSEENNDDTSDEEWDED
ncbi:hypothetical protein LUZ60_007003 [Juncus effusus]|nr:hypothetical protein LUZ60_007003 [Juncus effusus]